jgi:hypothetical protein
VLDGDGAGKRLAIETLPDGRLSLFCIGLDDAVWQNQQLVGGGWSGWSPLGGNAKELVAGRSADGRIYLFYIAGNAAQFGPNLIRFNYQLAGGAWNGDAMFSTGTLRAIKLALGRTADGRLELIASTKASSLQEYYQPTPDASFTGPVGLSSEPAKNIAFAAPNANAPLEVLFLGHENAIHADAPGSAPGVHSADRLIGDEIGPVETRLCIMTDEYQSTTVSCPPGQVIDGVHFASYGTPTGVCGAVNNAFNVGTCNAGISTTVVERECLGKPSCTIDVNNTTFGPDDPCVGTVKRLYAFLHCG